MQWRPLEGGFEQRCWTDGRHVLKVWDDELPASLPVLAALDLPVAVPTGAGRLFGWAAALFPFIEGRAATDEDAPALARMMRRMHDHPAVDLPPTPIDETEAIATMRRLIDHPWIRGRRAEVEEQLDRLERAIERAEATDRPLVICHTDFGGHNALIDEDTGEVAAILDWDYARLAPREHDLWAAFDEADPGRYLDAYGRDVELDPVHLEYALLARAVRDAAARLESEQDREGVDKWGFDRWRRLDRNLEIARG